MTKLLILDRKLILDILAKKSFYKAVPAFGSMYAAVENIYKRMHSEGMLNPDGTINQEGCKGCKARQFRDVQNNLVDGFVNGLLQIQNAKRQDQLNLLKEFLTQIGYPAEEVQVEYIGPCTKQKPVVIRF